MILALIFGFIAGIAIGSFLHLSFVVFIAGISLSITCFGYSYFVDEKSRKILILASIALLGLVGGVGRMYFSDLYIVSHLEKYVKQKIIIEGIIVQEPDVREHNTKLTISVSNVGGENIKVKENILVSVPIYPEFHYGDKIRAEVTLEKPEAIESEDGRVFDYSGYLRVRGIWYTSRYSKVTLISVGNGNIIKSLLFRTKHAFTNSLGNALPEPESSLMAGLLLGTKQSLGKDLLTEFSRAGVSHVVVLSGYNIAIVATSIMSLLKFLPKNLSFGFGVVSIILFTILSGGGASAWRAAIMVLVALFASRMNRDYKASRALGFAVLLMLTPNPLLLAFDPSFQLSILATIGLIFVSPLVSPYLTFLKKESSLREIVSSTIATQIIVLPFLIYNTGLLSLVSLPVNILILGTIPPTMLLGFITGIVGFFSIYLSFIPALPSYILLWYQLTIVHIGANLHFGAISLPAFSPIILLMVYVAIFISLYSLKKKV
ncbi:MAG: ComEC/Rec2 family competence protein [Minisyncoccia bacterium]